jgi:hypothetical protein
MEWAHQSSAGQPIPVGKLHCDWGETGRGHRGALPAARTGSGGVEMGRRRGAAAMMKELSRAVVGGTEEATWFWK